MSRQADINHLYALLERLRRKQGGFLHLKDCGGRLAWPVRGVYFFFDGVGEPETPELGPRVVRVGTHALKHGSSTTLWHRLSQHAGPRKSGCGNHRGSIFRLLVGEALKRRTGAMEPESWGIGDNPGKAGERFSVSSADIRQRERALEIAVSQYIGSLPFLVVNINDDPGPSSLRGLIERNSIALLSCYGHAAQGGQPDQWLGNHSGRDRVRRSRLWNNNHVDEQYDPLYLARLEEAIAATSRIPV